MSMKKIVVH